MKCFQVSTPLAIFVTIACASSHSADPALKLADQIVGKWAGEGGSVTIAEKDKTKNKVYVRKAVLEIRKDGTFTMTTGDLPELKESPHSW